MILDQIQRSNRYEGLDPLIALGLAFLRDFDADTPDGRIDLSGDDLFALVQSYHTAPATEKRFETHRVYADIQFVATGRERILYSPVEALEVETDYDASTDLVFYREPAASTSLLMQPGTFAVFYPDDAHKPGCMAGGREAVKKVVLKVRV
jgi:biofilm protein TabA